MTPASKSVLILGATSDIGRAIAGRYAAAGWSLILTARDVAHLDRDIADLAVRHQAKARALAFDVLDLAGFPALVAAVGDTPDTVVSVIGELGDQDRAMGDPAFAANVMRANFEGPSVILALFATAMAVRGSGVIVGVSSVAGERGRASNFVYGSAKAGFTAFLSGLRQSLTARGLHVVTVKPGFVRTRMTDGMALPAALTATADEVGAALFAAAETRRTDILYVRWMWRFIMLIIKLIPETVFKRLQIG